MKRIEAGLYESATHRVYKRTQTEYKTYAGKNRDFASTARVTDWVLVDLLTGNVAGGFGSKKSAMSAI